MPCLLNVFPKGGTRAILANLLVAGLDLIGSERPVDVCGSTPHTKT